MGRIDLDPASHPDANQVIQASVFYTAYHNGLIQNWFNNVFINPPGGLVAEFWKKLISSSNVEQAIWVGYSLEQLQTLQVGLHESMTPLNFSFCVPRRRIPFVENPAKRELRKKKMELEGKAFKEKGSPSHANYISYLGDRQKVFKEVFSQFGKVVLLSSSV